VVFLNCSFLLTFRESQHLTAPCTGPPGGIGECEMTYVVHPVDDTDLIGGVLMSCQIWPLKSSLKEGRFISTLIVVSTAMSNQCTYLCRNILHRTSTVAAEFSTPTLCHPTILHAKTGRGLSGVRCARRRPRSGSVKAWEDSVVLLREQTAHGAGVHEWHFSRWGRCSTVRDTTSVIRMLGV